MSCCMRIGIDQINDGVTEYEKFIHVLKIKEAQEQYWVKAVAKAKRMLAMSRREVECYLKENEYQRGSNES